MALPSLLGGAECAVNPLQQLLKHSEDEGRSLRHDGYGAQAGPSGLRTQGAAPAVDADAQRFFARQPLAHQFGPQQSAFDPQQAHAEAEDMARMEHLFAQHQLGPQPAAGVAGPTQDWRSAYAAEQQRAMSPTMGQQATVGAMPQQSQYRRSPMPFYGGGAGGGMMYRSSMAQVRARAIRPD